MQQKTRERIPIKIFGNWRVRSVKIFDKYGWIAQRIDSPGMTKTSEEPYDDPETAFINARKDLMYE